MGKGCGNPVERFECEKTTGPKVNKMVEDTLKACFYELYNMKLHERKVVCWKTYEEEQVI